MESRTNMCRNSCVQTEYVMDTLHTRMCRYCSSGGGQNSICNCSYISDSIFGYIFESKDDKLCLSHCISCEFIQQMVQYNTSLSCSSVQPYLFLNTYLSLVINYTFMSMVPAWIVISKKTANIGSSHPGLMMLVYIWRCLVNTSSWYVYL